MKKILFVLFTLVLFTATAQAAEPVRIARLPIMFQSVTTPDDETCKVLETKIQRAIHIPLNGTLQLAEYLPTNEAAQALNEIYQSDFQAAMRPLAEKLDADIIVCPILKQYSQYVSFYSGWSGDTIINAQVIVELVVYDRRTDELIAKKDSEFYHGDYTLRGTASALSKVCFDNVIDKTKIKERIRAIR